MAEEENDKKTEYEINRYHNMSEEKNNKKIEYARNRYHTMIKVC